MFGVRNQGKRALKGEKLRINWIPIGDHNIGTSRTNVWHVHDELLKMDRVVSTVNGEEWDRYDVVIFQKVYDKKLFRHVRRRSLLGFSLGDEHDKFEHGIRSADFVLCSCEASRQQISLWNKNCHVIIEGERMSSYPHKKASGDGNEVVLLFHGNIENVPHLAGNVAEAVNDLRVNRNVSVKIISNFQDTATIPYLEVPIRLCQWNLERFNQEALSGDIGIIPQGSEPRFLLKSANKIRTLMAMKIPVIGDKRNQDFRETLGDNRYGMLAHTRQEWKASLELLIDDLEQRRAFAEAGYQRVAEHYTTAIAAKQVIEAIGGYVAAC